MAGGKFKRFKQQSNNTPPYKKKSLGQHMLTNQHTIDSIIRKSGLRNTDVVLEIGPGTGALTEKLIEAVKRVIAVENDEGMAREVERRIERAALRDRFMVIRGDVLECELPYFDICVANIPYQISSPLVFKLLGHKPAFRCAFLMFQREFALRLIALPGDTHYCRLSANVQLLARVSHLLKVEKKDFKPQPQVGSCVVQIEPRKPFPLPEHKLREWDGMLRICFSRKNKTIGSIFRQKKILTMLEKNYKIVQTLAQPPTTDSHEVDFAMLGESFEKLTLGDKGDDFDDDDDMEMDDLDTDAMADVAENKSRFKEKVANVLRQYGYEDKRSSKLKQNEFIHLLSVFNEAHIHFA